MILLDALLAGVSFIEAVDVTTRIISGLAAVILAVYGVRHYRSKIKVNNLDAQIKEQQLFEIIQSNRKRGL